MKAPLAHRLRPTSLSEVVGQEHLTSNTGILKRQLEAQRLLSMIFFGPSGSGKTTVAFIMAQALNLPYEPFNAVTGNKKALDDIFAKTQPHQPMVVIVDEVHRLNKDKQDLLLPYLEDGRVVLIGLTSMNPYFAINPAIRSRCLLCEFKALDVQSMKVALTHALTHPQAHLSVRVEEPILAALIQLSGGDVRMALNTLEALDLVYPNQTLTLDHLHAMHVSSHQAYDQGDDGYYDALSAFQKSIRGSQVDAALYYLARLIVANDLDSIERRLLVTAYEDIGLANPALVARTVNACDVARRVGFPEAMIPLAVAVIELSLSPKSKSANNAIHRALDEVRMQPKSPPPYLRLTPVNLDPLDLYDYERSDLWSRIDYLPEGVEQLPFYQPLTSGPYENTLANNLEILNRIQRSRDLRKLKQEKRPTR
jgi:putative ATPase